MRFLRRYGLPTNPWFIFFALALCFSAGALAVFLSPIIRDGVFTEKAEPRENRLWGEVNRARSIYQEGGKGKVRIEKDGTIHFKTTP